ncbi:MAG: M3 family oligoendopeptidase [Chloroflexota bacterium]
MLSPLLANAPDFTSWTWADIEPRYAALETAHLDEATVDTWLKEWSELSSRVQEILARLRALTTCNTADEEMQRRLHDFMDHTFPRVEEAEQRLRQKLLASGLEPEGFAVPLRQMRADVALFRDENLPLMAQESRLVDEYYQITGAQTAEWEGKTMPLQQLRPLLQEHDRAKREQVWKVITERQLRDRAALNDLWTRMLALRRQITENAGFPDYRAYRWQAMHRFDYTPEDAQRLHAAVEEVVVPAVARLLERRRERLDVETLRPWDLEVDPQTQAPLTPFQGGRELEEKTRTLFHRLDPQLAGYFDDMVEGGCLDLDSRDNKAPGGYCSPLEATGLPFIFGNVAGTRGDVEMLIHEGGHAFHMLAARSLPYLQQRSLEGIGMEFAEVGSMAMELLAAPYLDAEGVGFYTPEEAARARVDHLKQRVLLLWSRLMLADAFQHWVYTHPDETADPVKCDEQWLAQTHRFVPVVDFSGLETETKTGWHNLLHIFVVPFYIIEYALAQLGAVQIWARARQDPADALARYKHALALGNTRPVPELYAAAGARLAFDAETLRAAVDVVESTIAELSAS